jgi:hypothetical protein
MSRPNRQAEPRFGEKGGLRSGDESVEINQDKKTDFGEHTCRGPRSSPGAQSNAPALD